MNEKRFQFLDNLGDEFSRLEREAGAAGSHSTTGRWMPGAVIRRGRRGVAVLGAMLVLLGGAAAAAVVKFDRPDPTWGLLKATKQRVLAQGLTSDGQPWLLAAGDKGHAFCLSLRIGDPAKDPLSTANCGGMRPATFGASLHWRSEGHGPLLFGTAPDDASALRVQAPGAAARDVPLVDEEDERAGKFFVVELPSNDLDGTRVAPVGPASGARAVNVERLLLRSSPY